MARLEIGLSSLDGVADGLREFYVQGPDKLFYPDLDVEALPTVKGLASTLRKFKEVAPDASKLAERMAKLEELEKIDPTEYQRLKEEAEGRKGKETNVELLQKEHARKLEEIQTDAQRRIRAAEEAAQARQQAAEAYFRDSELTAAIARAKGRPHMLKHELERQVKVETGEDGRFRLIVLGPGGEQRIKDSAGNRMGLDDLVGEYRGNNEWGGAFEPTGVTGSGAQGGGSGLGGSRSFNRNDPTAWAANADRIAKGEMTAAG